MNFHVHINISYGKIETIKREKKESILAGLISLGDRGGRLVPPCASGRRTRPYALPSLLQECARMKRHEGGGRRRAGAVAGPWRAPAALVRRGASAPCRPRRASWGGCRRGALQRGVVAAGRRRGGVPRRCARMR